MPPSARAGPRARLRLPLALLGALALFAVPGSRLAARMQPGAAVVRGAVILPDEGSPKGLHAYLVSATHRDSVAIGDAARFELNVGRMHCGPLELRIDVPSDAERRYHAVVVHLDSAGRPVGMRSRPQRADADSAVRVLLVPTRHRIDGGTHAGAIIPIDLEAAFAPTWARTRYWRVARATSDGYGTPVAWPESFFPIPVSLRARGGVSTADSAAFWHTARQLELDFGRSLFQPARDEPSEEDIWKIIVTVESAVPSAGMTFVTYDSHGAIYEATIAIRTRAYFADARLVSHELMHALGFGHSSGWYSAAGAAPGASTRATATDVAYAQLLYRLRRAHIAQEATHGIMASSVEGRRALSARASRCGP